MIVVPKWTADIEEDGSAMKELVDAVLEIIPEGNMDVQTFKEQVELRITGGKPRITRSLSGGEGQTAQGKADSANVPDKQHDAAHAAEACSSAGASSRYFSADEVADLLAGANAERRFSADEVAALLRGAVL